MNEIIHKNVKRFLAGIGALVLCFSYTLPVFADNQSDIMWIFNNPQLYSKYTYNGYSFRIRFGTSNTNSLVTPVDSIHDPNTIYMLKFKIYNGNWNTLFYTYSDTALGNSTSSNTVRIDKTTDKLNFTCYSQIYLTSLYTYSDNNMTGRTVAYASTTDSIANNNAPPISSAFNIDYCPSEVPKILLKQGQNVNSILAVISKEDFTYLPWNGTNSSGGVYWDDGTTLDSENADKYNTIYNVMDVDNDNSVTIAEVNYYNQTYNTNYDYSEINNDSDFTAMEFLYWVATEIDNGNDNPGGGSGNGGGGSDAITGGISIGDGSFTQQQQQKIESNAVNVTVTNNNELTNENLNHINQIINNNPETTENTFQDAISNMNQFREMAAAFAALAGVVLGWLPSWVTGLIGLSFSILSVMIIFRLIHLFV